MALGTMCGHMRPSRRTTLTGSTSLFRASFGSLALSMPFDAKGEWHEVTSGTREKSHTFKEIAAALGGQVRVRLTD